MAAFLVEDLLGGIDVVVGEAGGRVDGGAGFGDAVAAEVGGVVDADLLARKARETDQTSPKRRPRVMMSPMRCSSQDSRWRVKK